MQEIGGQLVHISFEPFAETARLLYTSAFMAERYAGIRNFIEGKVGGLLLPWAINLAASTGCCSWLSCAHLKEKRELQIIDCL